MCSSFSPAEAKDWRAYRIAWCDELGIPVSAEIRAKIARLVSDLEVLGCAVESAKPNNLLLNDAMETYGELLGAGLAAAGSKIPLSNGILRLMSRAEKIFIFKDNRAARTVDIDVDGMPVNYFPATSGYVTVFNVTGHPVVVIPLGQTKAGLAGKISREITGPFCPPPGY